MAARASKIAAWVKLPGEALAKLDDLLERLEEVAPRRKGWPQRTRRCSTVSTILASAI